jgi:hypothetical protein
VQSLRGRIVALERLAALDAPLAARIELPALVFQDVLDKVIFDAATRPKVTQEELIARVKVTTASLRARFA